jgi:hypothetical protein
MDGRMGGWVEVKAATLKAILGYLIAISKSDRDLFQKLL